MPSSDVSVAHGVVQGKVTIGLTSHLTHTRVEENLAPQEARSLAARLEKHAERAEVSQLSCSRHDGKELEDWHVLCDECGATMSLDGHGDTKMASLQGPCMECYTRD